MLHGHHNISTFISQSICTAGSLSLNKLGDNYMIECAADIARKAYIEERLNPKPDEWLYMHLSDLRIAVERIATSESILLLDYGCGGSPYEALFPNARYHKADFVPVENIDFRIDNDSLLAGVKDDTYDLVLSTQVLEHVVNPQLYLAEALRVLRPGGKLAITTHGVFWDHGCPFDYRRWTADGLANELKLAGFRLDKAYKLTTNARAALFLSEQYLPKLNLARSNRHGLITWLLKKLFWVPQVQRNKWSDAVFADNRVVDASMSGHDLYIALMSIAYKPTTTLRADVIENIQP